MIDKTTIDRIQDTAQILEVVSDFVTLKKRGVNYLGLCPFHDDRTPSFSVSPSKSYTLSIGIEKLISLSISGVSWGLTLRIALSPWIST